MKTSPYYPQSVVCLTSTALVRKAERADVLAYFDQRYYGLACSLHPQEYLLHDYNALSLYDAREPRASVLLKLTLADCAAVQETYEVAVLREQCMEVYDFRQVAEPVLKYDHMSSDNPPQYFLSTPRSLLGVVRKAPANLIGRRYCRVSPPKA
jgi:hypothetical protein